MRDAPDSVVPAAASSVGEQVHRWSAEPWAYDYFAVMRRLEALAQPLPRWGSALLPGAEAVRVGQEPSLAFAPASFSRFEPASAHAPPKLRQQFFGYLGPNGPLPVHLSEFIRERAINFGDPTWLAFLDTFSHRFSLHFYRAWAQSRPAVGLDRPEEDSFRSRVGALTNVIAKAYDKIKPGNVLMYYPEANVLVPRNLDPLSRTPAFKNVPVTLELAAARGTEPAARQPVALAPSAGIAPSCRDGMKAC